jgi:Major capsid protein 13-like
MAKTRIADIIVPSVFNPYVINRTTQKSALFQSGIVKAVPELALGVGKGNRLVNMPHFNDLTGDDETLSDGSSLTPDKITTGQDVATQLFRGRAWSTNDLAATMSGDDPMGAIGELVANYWVLRKQAALISTLKGAFSVLSSSHVNNLAIEAGNTATSANKISGGAIVDTLSKLGDAHDVLTGIVMHSVPYFNLVKQDLIQYVKSSDGKVDIPYYMGKRVIVDDSCPVVAGATNGFKYTSYLFGEGAIGYAEGQPEVPTETDRDSLAGDDILINRKHYILHPRGVKFNNVTVAGAAPTNAELELTANWSKVYQDKQIRMVALITNG